MKRIKKSNAQRQWEYRKQNNERIKNNHWHLKDRVLTYYGNGKSACVKCGFDDIRALSIDHIRGRRKVSGGAGYTKYGIDLYRYLENHNFPDGYQTLCMNCQWIKRHENDEFTHHR